MIAKNIFMIGVDKTHLANDVATTNIILWHYEITLLQKIATKICRLRYDKLTFNRNRPHIYNPIISSRSNKCALTLASRN